MFHSSMDPPMAQPHRVQASSTRGFLTNAAARTMLSLHHSSLLGTRYREGPAKQRGSPTGIALASAIRIRLQKRRSTDMYLHLLLMYPDSCSIFCSVHHLSRESG
ncbi:hypothetical protein F2Q70_00000528 [Brassica cretica]|uniref:Uncharacterized protein n=1 Tax=Brassica cretica TaxID=69181 RepID=A0A3N6QU76_BRACR|nr:hypothetical protein F2Q70_00000528 [Brassica cretica]KAF3564319.1 hypothetical protein DY000_02011554 [Brassica cretica]